MDQANLFETPTTYRLHRAEYLVFFLIAVGLFVAHIHQINWIVYIGLFAYIDVIGYLPGAIAWRRSPDHRIPKIYYVLYNTMHSLITQTAVVALWGLLVRWEWALLAIPIHLFGDRGLFGNFLKPFRLSFEPKPHPAYRQLRAALDEPADEPAQAAGALR